MEFNTEIKTGEIGEKRKIRPALFKRMFRLSDELFFHTYGRHPKKEEANPMLYNFIYLMFPEIKSLGIYALRNYELEEIIFQLRVSIDTSFETKSLFKLPCQKK